jgi:hypothetical protein
MEERACTTWSPCEGEYVKGELERMLQSEAAVRQEKGRVCMSIKYIVST